MLINVNDYVTFILAPHLQNGHCKNMHTNVKSTDTFKKVDRLLIL